MVAVLLLVTIGMAAPAEARLPKMPVSIAKNEARQQGRSVVNPGQKIEVFRVKCRRNARTSVSCSVFIQTSWRFSTCGEDSGGTLYGFRKQVSFTSTSYVVSQRRYRVKLRNYADYLEPLECSF